MDFTNHPFLNVIWTFFIIFVWVAWFWILITIAIDIFRRHDISGIWKAVWLVVIIFLPLIGCLIYLITQGGSMAERSAAEAQQTYPDDAHESAPPYSLGQVTVSARLGPLDE